MKPEQKWRRINCMLLSKGSQPERAALCMTPTIHCANCATHKIREREREMNIATEGEAISATVVFKDHQIRVGWDQALDRN